MPLRSLFRFLTNNEHLIQKLAESYPIRRAAQLAVSIFYRGKEKLGDVDPQALGKIQSFTKRFQENVKQGIEEAKKQKKL